MPHKDKPVDARFSIEITMYLSAEFLSCFIIQYLCMTRIGNCFLATPSGSAAKVTTVLPSLAEPPIRIASFNIQIFGQTKYSKTDVRDALLKILSRYDIIQVLEIRDRRGTVFDQLCNDLNTYMKTLKKDVTYAHVVSARLGRTTSKEQYGFLYRTKHLSLIDSYQMQDIRDEFEREPFGVRFRSPTTVLKEFGMVALHIQPSNVLAEMNEIPKIHRTFKNHWHLADILISGDFNADCSYLSSDQWTNVTTRDDPNYSWLIKEGTDTTVAPSRCSYDKFVATGKFSSAVVPGSVKVYRYDETLNLNESEALRISDHFPIELQLKGNVHVQTQQHLETKTSFTVKDNDEVTDINNIRKIYRTPSCAPTKFAIKLQKEGTHMDFVTATVSSVNRNDVMTNLMTFHTNCTGVLSLNLLGMVNGYMEAHYLSHNVPQVYGLIKMATHSYVVTVKCSIVSPNVCEVIVSYKISGP